MRFKEARGFLVLIRLLADYAAWIKDIDGINLAVIFRAQTLEIEIRHAPIAEFVWHRAENLTPVREPIAHSFDWILWPTAAVDATNFCTKRTGIWVLHVASTERPEC